MIGNSASIELIAREMADLRMHSVLTIQHNVIFTALIHQTLVHRSTQTHIDCKPTHYCRWQLKSCWR